MLLPCARGRLSCDGCCQYHVKSSASFARQACAGGCAEKGEATGTQTQSARQVGHVGAQPDERSDARALAMAVAASAAPRRPTASARGL